LLESGGALGIPAKLAQRFDMDRRSGPIFQIPLHGSWIDPFLIGRCDHRLIPPFYDLARGVPPAARANPPYCCFTPLIWSLPKLSANP
jgi:hypothetical protein